ncbi:hypothetical protein [Agromyces aerolatus]|uniref:hypothetical protein n=1 Tax=Agromyces sp. LY-1074 TaxID=3074080 RepID=UPI002858EE8A|nr:MULTISPECIES: hypothetical protein [unclassified Agromyces]MDR5700954.1 hypothetical protein [Agromyces sp. LY-1074]MDR5707385.1 hypothetical protein [Agromyces sp. LY-1358]
MLTVFAWSAEVADDWLHIGLPRYGEPVTDLFPTNRGAVVSTSHLWRKMDELVHEPGFPRGVDLHSLRRAYATHLLTEYRYELEVRSISARTRTRDEITALVAASDASGLLEQPGIGAINAAAIIVSEPCARGSGEWLLHGRRFEHTAAHRSSPSRGSSTM